MARLLMIVSSARRIDLASEKGHEPGTGRMKCSSPTTSSWRLRGGGGRHPRWKAATC